MRNLLNLALFFSKVSAACVHLDITTTTTAGSVGPHFASWNIDSSFDRLFFDIDWTNSQLLYLTKQIGQSSHLRFGGTGNDFLYYEVGTAPTCKPTISGEQCLNTTTYTGLVDLVVKSDTEFIFGLNIHPDTGKPSPPKGPWDSSNAKALLTDMKAQGIPIGYLEIGNEQNDLMTATQQGQALEAVKTLAESIWTSNTPQFVGPDTHSIHDAGSSNSAILKYLADFANYTSSFLHAITHHEYIEIDYKNVLNATFLNESYLLGLQVVQAVRNVSSTIEIWAGEIGPHNGGTLPTPNCADNRVCGKFGSSIWYADSMASKALAGYQLYCRQDLVGADYALLNASTNSFNPSSDYYLLLLWHALISTPGRTRILFVYSSDSNVRSYGYCPDEKATSVTLLLINLNPTSVCVDTPSFLKSGSDMTLYSLTPEDGTVESAQVTLNGVILSLDGNGKLPILSGQSVKTIQLPAISLSFLIIPFETGSISACV
jgi:heparanase 1